MDSKKYNQQPVKKHHPSKIPSNKIPNKIKYKEMDKHKNRTWIIYLQSHLNNMKQEETHTIHNIKIPTLMLISYHLNQTNPYN